MGNGKATGVVGGVCMAHAPQFFTLPETEDKATVERVHELARENGKRLEALEPDVTIVIANDHANQFLLHCVPPFALHRGKVARGSFAGRDFEFDIASDISTALVRTSTTRISISRSHPPPNSTTPSVSRSPSSGSAARSSRFTSTPTCRPSPAWNAVMRWDRPWRAD